MSKENSKENQELVKRLELIRELLDETIIIAKKNGPKATAPTKGLAPEKKPKTLEKLDFSMPIRPFVKKHCVGMNGQKKFTLLLAFLSGGDASTKISLEDIQKHWNKMSGKDILGIPFNRVYSTRARDNDWADLEETGQYHLRPSWKEIFNAKH